jgi:phage terminase large subunit GpA-like protein
VTLSALPSCFADDFDVELGVAVEIVAGAWMRAWTIPAPLTVSEWADDCRQIAQGAGAEPGQWRTSRAPYLREIQDCLSDHSPVRIVDFKKSAQIGATEVGINWTGYVIDRGLDSMIVAQPVKDLARSWATSKFDPAVSLMPQLRDKIESDNTLEKRFPGGTVWVIWANSSNQLRQRTARYIFEDEVDEYPEDLGGQGGATQQLEARALSYGDRAKIYRACTPTIAGASRIDAGFQEGDRRYYRVPCPHCGHHQVLHIDNLQPDGCFACTGCGAAIEEHHKAWMLEERSEARPDGAYWEPTNRDADPAHRSYHIWAAYTPEGLGLTWKAIADKRAFAEKNPSEQAGFTNLVLGEVFEGERNAQDSTEIEALAEPGTHCGRVPSGALVLTAGVDLQHDRFECQVIASGRGQRAHVIEYAVLDGDPSRPDGYAALASWLASTWPSASGIEMPLAAVAIDGGNWTEQAAQFVKSLVGFSGNQRLIKAGEVMRRQVIYLVRGRSEKKSDRAVYRPAKTEVNTREKTVARQVGIWGVGTSVLKHQVYGWLQSAVAAKASAEKSGEPEDLSTRMLRFPGGKGERDPLKLDPGALPESYFKGLTVEYFDQTAKKWVCPRGARNEPLDTLVYALWAALSPAVKIDAMRESHWRALEALYESANDLFAVPSASSASRETSDLPARRAAPKNPFAKDGWGFGP